MGLLITNELPLSNGFIITEGYVRVSVVENLEGTMIGCTGTLYKDKICFGLPTSPIEGTCSLLKYRDYDRLVDGSDILGLAHDALIEHLLEQGIVAVKEL